MKSKEIKRNADYLLYECDLLNELQKYGVPHIVGSYRMDMMAWNDLDIDIENDTISLDRLYNLTTYIINTFHPTWYEAKEELTAEGKKVWFHGFETMITGELWNIDLWFFDKQTIDDAERYCDAIAERSNQSQKEIMIDIKQELISRGLYCFEKYTSMDVYRAVMEQNRMDIDEFLSNYKK